LKKKKRRKKEEELKKKKDAEKVQKELEKAQKEAEKLKKKEEEKRIKEEEKRIKEEEKKLKEEKKAAAVADKKKGLVPDVQKSSVVSVNTNANPIAVSDLPFDEKGKDIAPVSPLQKILKRRKLIKKIGNHMNY